jgi:hypothetical protein
MDTPLHALALPDADRTALKRPEIAARELADKIALALASLRSTRASDQAESASIA